MDISWILVERCKKVHTKQPEITAKFTGYDLGKLEERWIVAVNGFFFFFHLARELNKVLDNTTANNDPVHRSSFNPKDERLVLTFVVTAVSGEKKRCHVFETGKGTKWIGDKEE
ncbi:hypothetical protein N7455_007416 [Penicillium solitum]|uniref:uncharacterized protein n=1 Tax=Penicillium solitum TaxID=60172 RepID=UPI0032C45F88|nr:hypothetical protein N7455_007416 [Penicillium solitum]